MSLTKLNIGTRLGLGFAAVLALLVAVLLLALNSMARIGGHTQDIINDKNVKMAAANQMVNNVSAITLAVTNIVMVPSTPEVQAEIAKIDEARKKYGAAKEILVKQLRDDKEKAVPTAAPARPAAPAKRVTAQDDNWEEF